MVDRLLVCLVVVAAMSCAGAAAAGTDGGCAEVSSIGVATMSSTGVITMRVRSLPPGPIAEAEFTYGPGDPKYEDVKRHLGGIAPGQTKPVPPWC